MTPGAVPRAGWEPTEALPDGDIQAMLLDVLCDSLAAAVFVYDRNDQLLFASHQMQNFFALAPELLRPGTRLRDMLGAIFDTGILPRDAAEPTVPVTRENWISETIASHWRERVDMTERYGADRWLRFVKRRQSSGLGICVISDVTEERRREERRRQEHERIQLTEEVLDDLHFPVFVKDADLVYVAVNKALCTKYQTTADQMLGKTSSDVFSPEVAGRFAESDRHVLETGEMSISRQRQIGRDGVERDVITRKHRIGRPGHYFLVATMQDLPKDGADFDEFEMATTIRQSGGQSYRRAYVPLKALREAAQKPVAMETFVPENFSGQRVLVVTADVAAASAALKMLGKYSFETCLIRDANELAAFLDVSATYGIRIDLVIADNQYGQRCAEIAGRHDVPAIVCDGFQLANELTFLIARHFNRDRQKDLTSGVTGVILDADGKARPPLDSAECQILVAEDNEINQIVFSQILEGLGYRYRIARTGDEAVQFWNECRPQLVLMDISLPGFNGFEAARFIRGLEGESGLRTPIIGVLAQAFDKDRNECFAAGMDDVILKPISPHMLETVFQKFIDGGREAAAL